MGLVAWVIVQVVQVMASARISGSGSVQEIAWGHLQQERSVGERIIGGLAVFARIDAISVAYALLTMGGWYRELLVLHAASATVGLLGREGSTLRKTILPTVYYLFVIGLLGLLAVYVIGVPDPMMRP